MANEGVLKENVDGEALLWAYSRLPAADRSKNIIVVLADGASVDDSTMAVNATGFLTLHAALVSRFVGAQPGVQLIGIGIDVDVSSIYEESYTIDPDNIGICLMNSLRQYIN